MSPKTTKKCSLPKRDRVVPTVSTVLGADVLVELLYDEKQKHTDFAVWKDGTWQRISHIEDGTGNTLVPYAADNKLIQNNVVLFPSDAMEYGTEEQLIEEVRSFIHRYVDVNERFEWIATYYVLLTWLNDCFNDLPYLRLQGDYGTGKTRFLLTVGAICYRPIFGSGASTVAPIFHMLDQIGGTLIIDEADFRNSDERADIVKILNNGNVRGIPVLRAQRKHQREFDPLVFNVFGPKIIAMRGSFDDQGLESRFISETFKGGTLRDDISINLPARYKDEAQMLRNKLLMYRFRHWGFRELDEGLVDRTIEPRLNQMFAPLLSVVKDKNIRADLRKLACEYDDARNAEQVKNTGDDYYWV